MSARRAWASRSVAVLGRGLDVPRYGDERWLAWDDDPKDAFRARMAALIVAAEAWAQEGDELPERLHLQVVEDHQNYVSLQDSVLYFMAWPEIERRVRLAIDVACSGIDKKMQAAS